MKYEITILLLVSLIIVSLTYTSYISTLSAAPIKIFEGCNPTNTDGSVKCCWYTLNDDSSDKRECQTCKWSESKGKWVCGKLTAQSTMGQTMDPKFGGNAGVLQEENTSSKDTNIGNSGGILIDRNTSGNDNQSSNSTSGTIKKQSSGGSNAGNSATQGIGQSQYVGNPDTWCKTNPDGSKTCTCKAGTTDCLHMCGVIDCSSDCVGPTGDCKVELPGTSASSDNGMPAKSKTQGTFDPSLTTGGKLSADTESKTTVIPKYSCSGDTCTCTGDEDCNDMFSSNACTEDIFEPTQCVDDTCTCTSAAAK